MNPTKSTLFQRQRQQQDSSTMQAKTESAATREEMERDNEAILGALLGDVRMLKKCSSAIGSEVKRHNVFLDAFGGVLTSTKDMLTKTTRKLDGVASAASNMHLWILFVFAFFVCIFIYAMIRWR